MPTGYTHPVSDGTVTSFSAFALRCARAFGALIEMRDKPADAAIPESFKATTDYHDTEIERAQQRLAELQAMGPLQVRDEAMRAHCEALRVAHDWKGRRDLQRQRYEAMLHKVQAWSPPTPDHAGLRDFMVDQLNESINFDCGGSIEVPALAEPAGWLENEVLRAEWSLNYHTDARAEEIARTASRNKWVAELRSSLAGTP